jgi:energy-coupling factor transport system substrate-specific component
MKPRLRSRLFSLAIYLASTASGLLVLLYPFFLPALPVGSVPGQMHAGEMPFLMLLLLGLCLLVVLYEAQGQTVNTKLIALLGVLVAINSALRFLETAIPGPGGFTPIFFLIILTGYVFGGRVGFLMGALTLLVSALVTGGVGPWLPSQMFTAGWVGMSTPLLRSLMGGVRRLSSRSPHRPGSGASPLQETTRRRLEQGEILLLAAFGLLWGFLYGAIMNLWEWPFIVGPQAQSWSPNIGLLATLQRYAVFYLATSLVWDAIGAFGTALMMLAFGGPALRVLRRFRQRFTFTYSSAQSLGQAQEAAHGAVQGAAHELAMQSTPDANHTAVNSPQGAK